VSTSLNTIEQRVVCLKEIFNHYVLIIKEGDKYSLLTFDKITEQIKDKFCFTTKCVFEKCKYTLI
jgi:hypothetical protein